MTDSTRIFLTNICDAIIDRSLDHDCRLPYEPCIYCEKAYIAKQELGEVSFKERYHEERKK